MLRLFCVKYILFFNHKCLFFFLNLPHCAQERFALHSLNVENKMNKSAKAILLITVSVLNNKYWKVAYGK